MMKKTKMEQHSNTMDAWPKTTFRDEGHEAEPLLETKKDFFNLTFEQDRWYKPARRTTFLTFFIFQAAALLISAAQCNAVAVPFHPRGNS